MCRYLAAKTRAEGPRVILLPFEHMSFVEALWPAMEQRRGADGVWLRLERDAALQLTGCTAGDCVGYCCAASRDGLYSIVQPAAGR